ncbi:molecular chaperone HtpG [Synoicihabitans lomoniglobus]|uniref:Chaperone protein HtpG n=1 Tax=Synoicihabitans lomoniglobus TaxID=2909285 RepID=A0AAF0CPR9_9BACT|nr:molecular chaperone HtpG [Opitutaceae bacterium LMO-M01]WED65792.1 molecular chaperone HtpG [Opitutaceae bacterium LMO-M01]
MSETHEFQAEIKQLLDIVVHSLYTEKEIFVRELVSNASDALEKLRHTQITESEIFDADKALEINLTTDEKANTLTIQDYGIGMTRDELVKFLGTIAHSGSKAFLQAIKDGGAKNDNLIGQFGVGFYSAFMVAKSVKVYSRSWKADEQGHVWTSDGSGSYTVEEAADLSRGTKIVIELKDEDDCKEFAKDTKVKTILERYSAFVTFPINLNGERTNKVSALWLRSKNEITDEEYTEFYKFQAHAYDEPRLKLHFSADAPLSINSILFVPQSNPEKFGMTRAEAAVSLYCRKVLIDPAPKDLLPEWARFLKGVVDSEDLPLNISRETMQDRALIEKLGKVITKRFLKFLGDEAKNRPDDFDKFYDEFGIFLKEGAATDFTHKEGLSKLLRFESSRTEKGKRTSLADYVSRMGEEQKEIYYLIGSSREAIERGPYLEGFESRNLEVIFCYENVDDYVMRHLTEFDGKKFTAADSADVKLDEKETEGEALSKDEMAALSKWLKETLGDRVSEVKTSDRLVESPAAVLNADSFMSPQMRAMMKAMKKDGEGEEAPPLKVNLELNPRHAVIKKLSGAKDTEGEKAGLIAEQLFDNAMLAAGLLEDPTKMVQRLYKLLEQV